MLLCCMWAALAAPTVRKVIIMTQATDQAATREQLARDALAALPPAYADEARRIFSITVGVLQAREYGYLEAVTYSDEGLYGLLELADACTRVAVYLADPISSAPAPGRAFVLAWDAAHLAQCHDPRCSFTVHAEADTIALADPGESLERQLAAGRTAARAAEAAFPIVPATADAARRDAAATVAAERAHRAAAEGDPLPSGLGADYPHESDPEGVL